MVRHIWRDCYICMYGHVHPSGLHLHTGCIPMEDFVRREIEMCCLSMDVKTIVSVELLCSKCRQKVMKLIATIEDITSIVLDPAKNTVTVIGEADPVKIINKVRKFRKSATIVSIGPPKEEKKDDKDSLKRELVVPCVPRTCQRCDVWYVVGDDLYTYCSVM
ncbi:heavy metal-associated isoprenylated plant protein 2-like [Jatropha curcas]|uniref:heavy metal-associated isoprenylated plant protein 2-like n=1 Tax=Jatropha curcas TaxID=180498 RepID=UPI0009D79468|nr:heavy metal-associated isoprenylated plant protein 2-like [Jatropha curcas]